jgi:hypothetical protein
MKTLQYFIIIFSCLLVVAHADIPNKAPLVKYTGLWTNSPFTSKPAVVGQDPIANPLDDYTLTGIAQVPGGYMITIMNKKNPEKKEVITPGGKGTFKVVSVNRNPGQRLGTTVVLSSGSMQGTVSFEPDLVTLKAPPAAPQAGQQGVLPPGITAAQANQTNGADNRQRQPRPRIVPPPANAQKPAQNSKVNSEERRTERRR